MVWGGEGERGFLGWCDDSCWTWDNKGGFYLFVFIVVFSSPLTLSKCHWHFFTSGRSSLMSECHGTAQYTMLLPFGRDTVHCLYRVINSLTFSR